VYPPGSEKTYPTEREKENHFSTQKGLLWGDMLVPRRLDIGTLPPTIMVWWKTWGKMED